MNRLSGLIRHLFALTANLEEFNAHSESEGFTGAVDADPADEFDPSDGVADSLTALIADLAAAVPSYCGLQITVTEHGYPVVLTAFTTGARDLPDPAHADQVDGNRVDGPDDGARAVVTSLSVSLLLLHAGLDPDSRVVFYAAAPGGFVDLAADFTYALSTGLDTTETTPVRREPGGHPVLAGADGRAVPDASGRPGIRVDGDLPPPTRSFGLSGFAELSAINRAVGMMIERGHHSDTAHATLRRHAAAAGLAPYDFAVRLLKR